MNRDSQYEKMASDEARLKQLPRSSRLSHQLGVLESGVALLSKSDSVSRIDLDGHLNCHNS